MKTHSLRHRLSTAYAAVLALFMILFGAALTWGLHSSFNQMLYNSLDSVIIDIKYDLSQDPLPTDTLDPKEEFALSPVYIEVWKIDNGKKRRVLFSENMRHEHLPILPKEPAWFESIDIAFISEADGEDADESALLSRRVSVNGKTYLISVATPIDGIDDLLESFLTLFAFLGISLYLAALYLGYRMIDRVLSPMQSIIATADSISQSNLAKRVPLPAVQDEFFTLAQTFNTMLERVEKSFEKISRFNANVSHELKTPLTIIRGEVEVALLKEREGQEYRNVLQSVLEETATLQSIVENMLLLSKSDTAALQKRMMPTALDKLLLQAIDEKKPLADKKSITVLLERPEPVRIHGEATLLKQAIANLIDNAIKYSPPGTAVGISLKKSAAAVKLGIKDEGYGIDKDQLEKIFDPFYRIDSAHNKSTPGQGLGLSIVAWIMQLHQASIDVESQKEKGTRFTVTFTTQKDIS